MNAYGESFVNIAIFKSRIKQISPTEKLTVDLFVVYCVEVIWARGHWELAYYLGGFIVFDKLIVLLKGNVYTKLILVGIVDDSKVF